LSTGELLAQGEVLEGELAMPAEEEGEEPKQVEKESDHRAGIVSGSGPTDQSLGGGRRFGEGKLLGGRRIASDFDRASSAGRGSSLLLRHQLSFRQTV
jgi:hypothetical protein